MNARTGTGLALVGTVGNKINYALRSALITIGSDPSNELIIDERGGESHYRGPFSLDIVPDLREPLRAMCGYGDFAETETTVIVGPTQSLKTKIGRAHV